MPAQEIAYLRQTALVWPASGYDSYGQPAVAKYPTQISVRWNNTQTEMLNPQGNTISVDATVIVSQEIPMGSWLWLGSMDSWLGMGSGSGSAAQDEHLLEVKAYAKTADIKNRNYFRQLGLIRLHNTIQSMVVYRPALQFNNPRNTMYLPIWF